ncbi:beta strand repeat-containing protein [Undibacterium sp. RuRC25W]|uniref:beta strand repeat-containing protein n=1 Tax=Undibacterium sp. RuRC25W TaxID=3413047 RepID=UPI003BEFED3B
MNILQRYYKSLNYLFAVLITTLITTLVAGCGGGGGTSQNPILGLPAAALASVTVMPLTATVAIGGAQQFVATATYSDGSSRDVTATSTWTSGTTTVGTVNGVSGMTNGVSSGSTIITASFGGLHGSATLTVSPAFLVSMSVVPATPAIAIAATQQFTAMGTFSDGTTSDITAVSVFTSGSPSIATTTAAGLATGVLAGTSVITASSGTKTGTATLTVTPATLLSIAMTPLNPVLKIATTQQFSITASYSDGTTSDVTASTVFTSATPTIASFVSANGMVTAVAAGSSVVTGTVLGKSANTTVTVSPATLTSIAVTPATATIAVGSVKQFIATGNYSDGSSANITTTVNWTSGTTSVALVLPSGVANGLSGGTSTITAAQGGLTGTASLTVTAQPAALISISVTPPSATIAIAATQAYTATGNYSDGSSSNITNSVTWSSGTTTVATIVSSGIATGVAGGIATGVAGGTSTITATSNGKSGTAGLTVQAGPVLNAINVTPATASVTIGATQSFIATGIYSNGASADITNSVTWTSGTNAIATVQSNGVATGVSAGTSGIAAILGSSSGTALLTVLPALPAATVTSIAVTPALATIAIGGAQTFIAKATYSDGTVVDVSLVAAWTC